MRNFSSFRVYIFLFKNNRWFIYSVRNDNGIDIESMSKALNWCRINIDSMSIPLSFLTNLDGCKNECVWHNLKILLKQAVSSTFERSAIQKLVCFICSPFCTCILLSFFSVQRSNIFYFFSYAVNILRKKFSYYFFKENLIL